MNPSSIDDPVALYNPRRGAAITARITTIDTIDARDDDHHDDHHDHHDDLHDDLHGRRRSPPSTNGVGVGGVVTPRR
jgi:hypothetical protein